MKSSLLTLTFLFVANFWVHAALPKEVKTAFDDAQYVVIKGGKDNLLLHLKGDLKDDVNMRDVYKIAATYDFPCLIVFQNNNNKLKGNSYRIENGHLTYRGKKNKYRIKILDLVKNWGIPLERFINQLMGKQEGQD